MAVNLTNADQALKSYYLDVVSEQLNMQTNPFFAQIKQSTNDVYGKEVRKLCIYGVNGGIGAGTEDGNLPKATGNNYKQLVAPLKNLYGTIEISDKAIRASANNSGAFVDLLNAEMEGLIQSSKYNFSRMLFGNGDGMIAGVMEPIDNSGYIEVTSTQNLAEGMIVEFRDGDDYDELIAADAKIIEIKRAEKKIKVSCPTTLTADLIPNGTIIVMQGSYNNEITGLGAIFQQIGYLYGLSTVENPWIKPYMKGGTGSLTELKIQTALDEIEERSGNAVNFIVCSWGVRRAFQNMLASNSRLVNTMELAGGYQALSYNGIPVVADRFCPEGTMYLLNTKDFTLHQLCDWQWLTGDDGHILKQVSGKPVYTATLVKYAELLCDKPYGQGVLTGITEA